MVQTFRPKDRKRIIKIIEEDELNLKFLEKILKKYNLYQKFRQVRGVYYGKSC